MHKIIKGISAILTMSFVLVSCGNLQNEKYETPYCYATGDSIVFDINGNYYEWECDPQEYNRNTIYKVTMHTFEDGNPRNDIIVSVKETNIAFVQDAEVSYRYHMQ